MLELTVFSIINGVLYGMLLFMLSSGLTLIFSMMGVLNFAHASFYMMGAYFAYQISTWFGFWPALFLAPVLVALLGALVERYMLRYVHKYGHVAELLLTFGLVYIFDELVHLIWGRMPVDYRIPEALDFTLFTLFDTEFPAYRGFMFLVGLVMFLTLYLVLTRSRIGLIVQASLSHPDMVDSLGHNVNRVFTSVFALGTGLAGLAGAIAGNYLITEPGMAWAMGPIVFVVVVVGGLGSLTGALVASMIIGLLTTVAIGLNYSVADMIAGLGFDIPTTGERDNLFYMTLSRLGPVLPYLLLVLMLIFRPRGLMGTRES